MSTLKVTNIQSNAAGFNDVVSFQNSSGTQNGTLCRAWVNFNGTGVVAIRANFNVYLITDNGTGDYTINFTNAMVDANYAINVGAKRGSLNESLHGSQSTTAPTTGSCRIIVGQGSFATRDGDFVNVAIFR